MAVLFYNVPTVIKMTLLRRHKLVSGIYRTLVTSSVRRKQAETSVNTLGNGSGKGLFDNDLLDSPESMQKLYEKTRSECTRTKQRIYNASDSHTIVQAFDDLSNTICCGADLTECVRLLHSDPHWKQSAENCMESYVELVESLNTNHDLYMVLKLASHNSFGGGELDAVDKNVSSLLLHDFEQSGVHLDDDKRKRFVELSSNIFMTSAQFTRACDEPAVIKRSDIPVESRPAIEPYLQPDSEKPGQAFMFDAQSWSHNHHARQYGYEAFNRYNDESAKLLHDLLDARHELAKLTGFTSYAQRAQAHTLLADAVKAENFLEGLLRVLKPTVQSELDVLKEYNGGDAQIYDLSYLIARLDIKAHTYEPFLGVDCVLKGFNVLLHQLYGCSMQEVKPSAAEVWSPAVRKFVVRDEKQKDLGVVYGDFESRHNKHGGDCHITVRCSKHLPGSKIQTPVVVLSLSLHPGATAFSPAQAENAWHEFGHAMHSMFGKTRYQHVAGTRCSTDLAETPSNLMEYFFYDPTVMRQCLVSRGNQPISADLAERLSRSRRAFQTIELQLQVIHALLDLQLHNGSHSDNREQTISHYHELCTDNLFITPPEGTYWPHRFGHLVPYGAKYYCYHVAHACASLIWREKFAANPLDGESGLAWCNIQAQGGELPMSVLMKQMLGYEPSAVKMMEALHHEAEESLKIIQ